MTPKRARTAKKRREAEEMRRDFLMAHPNCQAALPLCFTRSVDVHEKLTRARGGALDDPDNLMAVCRPCHDWITTHPKEATERGWMRSAIRRDG